MRTKRFEIWKTDGDRTKLIAGFDTLKEAQEYLGDICEEVVDGKMGMWFIESQVEPIFLEIIDLSIQLDPMAVC